MFSNVCKNIAKLVNNLKKQIILGTHTNFFLENITLCSLNMFWVVVKNYTLSKIFKNVHTNNTRINQLQQWIADDTQDYFSRYALALEYGKAQEVGKMREHFEYLLVHAPQYLPTYYHAGCLYEELGEVLLAESTFAKGIKEATAQQDKHALHELRGVHTNLLMEYEVESTLD